MTPNLRPMLVGWIVGWLVGCLVGSCYQVTEINQKQASFKILQNFPITPPVSVGRLVGVFAFWLVGPSVIHNVLKGRAALILPVILKVALLLSSKEFDPMQDI